LLKNIYNSGITTLLLIFFFFSIVSKALVHYFFFENPSGDISIFVQIFYNTLHGDFMYSSFEGGNHLGVHFSPVLILFVPVMALFRAFPALTIANGFLLVLALFWLCRHLEKSHRATALVIVIMLTCHATLSNDTYKDFHALSTMILPFFGVFIAFQNRNLRAFIFWAIVLATIRENMFLPLLSWSLICFYSKREKPWIFVPLGLGLAQFLIANLMAPAFFEGGIRPGIGDYFLTYGRDTREILTTVQGDPLLPFRILFSEGKGSYLLGLTLPFLVVIPFLRLWWLPALPILMVILFSSDGRLADPKLHFSVEVVLWMALSVIAFLKAMLEAGGFHVHAFTSPALRRAGEQIAVRGRAISGDALDALANEIAAAVPEPLTPFETLTAAACLAFARDRRSSPAPGDSTG